MTPPRREGVAFAVLVAVAAGYSATRFKVGGDISHFLPADGDARLAAVSRALASSELPRTLALLLEGADPPALRQAARALALRLRAHPEVAWLRAGVDAESERSYRALYLPRRHAMLSDEGDGALRERLSDPALREAARALKRRLASPAGALFARGAGDDPLQSFAASLDRLRGAQGDALRVVDGQLVTADGRGAVIVLATRASPFDAARQRRFLADLQREFVRVRTTARAPLTLRRAGAHPVAVAAEAETRGDAQRVSVVGSLGVAAIFLLLHRSLRYLALASIPLAAGTALAIAACLAVFGSLHGLTLAFGASLIGVCFDYPIYLIHHHTLRPSPEGPRGTLARVWPGLKLGAMTTVGGLLGLGLTSVPGLRELALFSAVGVLGALLATRALVAPALPAAPDEVSLQRRAADAVSRGAERLRGSRVRWLAPALALGLSVAGLPRLRWEDDVRALTRVDPALADEERRVSAALDRGREGRFVVAMGRTDEEALRRNDMVASRLRASGLAGARSAHAALWSRSLQARNEAALRADPTLPARLDAAFAAEGFRGGAFGGFARALREAPPPPLTYDALVASPLADLVRPYRIRVGDRYAYLTYLPDDANLPALRQRLAGVEGVEVFDQRSFLREAYAGYRLRTLAVLAAGLGAVFATLFARYRRARVALAAMAPAVAAASASLGLLGALGISANLMHLVGVILVLSVGADYGIFTAEVDGHPEAVPATTLSLVVAWSTTLLTFGLLGLSSAAPLRAIGLVTAVGVTLSLALSPLTRSLGGGRR
ncbi:MAG: hypothetical protein R3A48_14280 [Polyangiales bacterium]